jgi:hypothetical protein
LDYTNYTLTVYGRENTAPELINSEMEPTSGNIDSTFGFSVHYNDVDSDVPVYINVIIDSKPHNMSLKTGSHFDGIYEYKTKLSEGKHIYYFITSDGLDTTRTPDNSTFYIEASYEKSNDDINWDYLVIIIVILIIIILIIIVIRASREQK